MYVGVDLGSRTVKLAALSDGELIGHRIRESGFDPHGQSLEMLADFTPLRVVATGYGRHLARKHFAHEVITEIKAHALGARHYYPDCRTIVDIGGQDSKVIALDEAGRVVTFQMNDKCAAGTGRFLEIMAATLGYSLTEFGPAALAAAVDAPITSMCTVFAESEVISMKNRGVPAADIARGVHLSVVNRLVAMLSRVGFGDTIVFSGGVARNPAMVRLLAIKLDGARIVTPEHPDIVGAIGAAIQAGIA